ncbi:MAG: hypothetical protein PVJ49_04480 [Acidobacteriota bacterium]
MKKSMKTSFAVVCAVAVLLATPVVAQQQNSEEMDIVRRAEQLVQQQRPDEALQELQKVFDEDPEFAPAYFVAGLAYRANQQKQEAYDAFVKATELNPGWGAAERFASMYAADLGDLEASWDHAIKAQVAGTDMSDAFAGLQTMGPAPDDWQARVNAARVWVAPMNVEQFLAHEENPFGRMIDASGDPNNTDNVSNSRATSVGARVVSESSADRASVMRRMRQRVADSQFFGLVGTQEQATYILVLEAEDIGENPGNRPLEGHLNLLDARSGEQVHRMRIEMRNIASEADINRDLDRIIGSLEDWAAEQLR